MQSQYWLVLVALQAVTGMPLMPSQSRPSCLVQKCVYILKVHKAFFEGSL